MSFTPRKLAEVVKEHTLNMLEHFGRNKMKTAWELGVSDRTLSGWLHKWGLFEKYRGDKCKTELSTTSAMEPRVESTTTNTATPEEPSAPCVLPTAPQR